MNNSKSTKETWFIGYLRSGNEVFQEHCVHMPADLVGNRLAVFAQSGFGKTNAVKVILWEGMGQPYGKLVFDRRGEYVPDTTNEDGEIVPGLLHHHAAREKIVLFTNRSSTLANPKLKASLDVRKFSIGLEQIPAGELVQLYPNLTDPQREFLYLYEDDPKVYANVMSTDSDGQWDEASWSRTLTDWFGNAGKLESSPAKVIRSIRKKLVGMQRRPFVSTKGNGIEQIIQSLKDKKTVVIDLSGYISELDRVFVTTLIARKLFEYNLERLDNTDPSNGKVKTVVFFEEAQTLLASDRLNEGSIFVDIAKEGRALEIGLVAITQQPSAISTSILSQFNSFLALHLEFMDDIHFLKKVAGNFEGLETDLRRKVPGNAYLVTRLKPFAIPLKVFHFNDDFVSTQ